MSSAVDKLRAENAKLKAQNLSLRDLLETQYRATDRARGEADKADEEAQEHKIEAARLRMLGTRNEYDLVWSLKRKIDALKATKKSRG